jgi:flavin reductase (DIM6/NTAB) family NADH-FMN oxidoreductase RutF
MAADDAQGIFDRVDRAVWIVTSADGDRRAGLVATFVTPASIVPELPRVLLGLDKSHETCRLVEASAALAVHLLDESQLELVWRFGLQSSRDADKFADLAIHTAATGSPILAQALAWIDCRVEARLDIGDRIVYLGEVVDTASAGDAPPLSMRRLLELAPEDKKAAMREQLAADAARDADAIRRRRGRN